MNNIYEILLEQDCIKQGHFLLKSKKHSGTYCDAKDLSFEPDAIIDVCKQLTDKIRTNLSNFKEIDVVVGPAVGAIIPAFLIASYLGANYKCSEKKDGGMYFRKTSNLVGKRILVVEDVATTGGTVEQTIEAIKQIEGTTLLAVAVIVDRSNGEADFGVPLISGVELDDIPVYEANDCPLCKEGKIELYKPGSKN